MKSFFSITLIALSCATVSHADGLDQLTLTDVEMQKLKNFFPVEENTHLFWQGDPLEISLPMGKEKRLVFPESVTVDVKGALMTDQLRVVNNDKSIYLTALKAFPKTRIFVTLQENKTVIMLDIVTKDNAKLTTQYIEVKQREEGLIQSEVTHLAPESRTSEPVTYVDLIRFAYQQLYAPERLLRHSPQYPRVPMGTKVFTSNLIYGDKVIVHPVASWGGGDYYVTVVALQNKYAHLTHINFRKDICGDWLAATIYPRATLAPYGDKLHDSAMLFLVSRGTFSETIGVCYGDA